MNPRLSRLGLACLLLCAAAAHADEAMRASDYARRRVVQVTAPVGGTPSAAAAGSIQEGPIRGVHAIVSSYGENHRVPVSRRHPNIINTPFARAHAVGLKTHYDLGSNGSAILVTPKTDKPFFVSITDADNPTGMPISLTLVPTAKLDSQTITVSLGGRQGAGAAAPSGGFPQQLAAVIRDIVMLKTPAGYSVRPLRRSFAMASGMSVSPVERYSGNEFDIFRYRLKNTTGRTQTLAEEMFGADARVVAVAFYPKIQVRPGESTDVLIMVGRER